MGSLGERPHFGPKLWGHWLKNVLLVIQYSKSPYSPIEPPNIEYLTLKSKIVHRII